MTMEKCAFILRSVYLESFMDYIIPPSSYNAYI